jgi:acetyltransferase-like isoleucine patch superfamily enzyme
MRTLFAIISFLKVLLVKCRYNRNVFIIGQESYLYPPAQISANFPEAKSIRIGKRTIIKGELLTFCHGGAILIGDDCFIGQHTHIWSACAISIGDRVLISHNVNIFDNYTHPISAFSRHEQFNQIRSMGHPRDISLGEKPVNIENDVLIGCGAIILRGVTLGKGAIIGAGSVVTHSVPPWTIIAGNPAKVIREIPLHER